MNLNFLISFFILHQTSAKWAWNGCHEGSHAFQNLCYQFFDEEQTFEGATKECSKFGGSLASLTTEELAKFAESIEDVKQSKKKEEKNRKFVWMGLVDVDGSGKHVWNNGEEALFKRRITRKANLTTPTCFGFYPVRDWQARRCDDKLPYLCSIPKSNICPDGWAYGAAMESCYKHVRKPTIWQLAEKSCNLEGAHLTTLGSKEEDIFLSKTFEKNGENAWFGKYTNEDRVEKYTDGSNATRYVMTNPEGKKSRKEGEWTMDCGYIKMVLHGHLQWNWNECNQTNEPVAGFICKKGSNKRRDCRPVPEPAPTKDPGPVTCEKSTVDLVFVVDSSGSIEEHNFRKILNSLKKVVSKMDIGTGTTQSRIGLVTFSDKEKAKVVFRLSDTKDKQSVLKAIDSVQYDDGGTDIASGMKLAFLDIFFREALNNGKQNVMIVITDGSDGSDSGVKSLQQHARAMNVSVFALGIGRDLDIEQLRVIAGANYRAYTTLKFDFLDDILKEICTNLKGDSSRRIEEPQLTREGDVKKESCDLKASGLSKEQFCKERPYCTETC